MVSSGVEDSASLVDSCGMDSLESAEEGVSLEEGVLLEEAVSLDGVAEDAEDPSAEVVEAWLVVGSAEAGALLLLPSPFVGVQEASIIREAMERTARCFAFMLEIRIMHSWQSVFSPNYLMPMKISLFIISIFIHVLFF